MIGRTLKHYKIEALLGKGGMGEVYRAIDTKLDRPIALKVLRPEFTQNLDRRLRFIQEARAAAAVVHPGIAQIYDVDEEEGITFIAMEFVEGQTVRQLIVNKELDLIGSVEIALQVSEGLSRAHKANIVHRDIKSDNIMITKDGHAKLLDFGLAKLLDQGEGKEGTMDLLGPTATMAKTLAGTVVGTLAYMSPEQARGQDVKQSSDVFSMGIVIYEMVTGELPFKGGSPLDTMHSIAYEEARPVTVVKKNIPPQLHRIITRCLRKRPEDRYADAAALATDLKHLKQDLDTGITRSLTPLERIRSVLDGLMGTFALGPQAILIGLVAVCLTIILIFTDIPWGLLFWVAIFALLGHRSIKNRKTRLLKKFTAKMSKYPGVSLIHRKEDLVTVFVDQAQAKLYIRANDLIEEINGKLFFGKHMEVAIQDEFSDDEFMEVLRSPGVLFVREDVFQDQT
jgi:serine/threonine protein kinase